VSERILKVLLSELQTVRIICKKCAAVAEMTAKQVNGISEYNCLGCGILISAKTPLRNLASALDGVKNSDAVEVQFIIPEPAPET
jgi:hypothetical protein